MCVVRYNYKDLKARILGVSRFKVLWPDKRKGERRGRERGRAERGRETDRQTDRDEGSTRRRKSLGVCSKNVRYEVEVRVRNLFFFQHANHTQTCTLLCGARWCWSWRLTTKVEKKTGTGCLLYFWFILPVTVMSLTSAGMSYLSSSPCSLHRNWERWVF